MKQQTLFKERKDGILEYCGSIDAPTVAEAWQTLDAQIDVDIWAQASIAAAIKPVWDKGTVEEFALQVEKTPSYIYKIAKTYKYYAIDQKCTRVQKLTFKHHTLALRHPNPGAALLHAREKGMNTVRFEEYLVNEINEGKVGGRSALTEIALSEIRSFLEHVEEVIQGDFIANCPDKAFGARLFGAWLNDAREENKQLYISDVRELVDQAIEKRAARTIPEIIKATGFRKNEVESAVEWLIADQEKYEWVEKGGETDEARGSNSKILHRVGQRDGTAYNAPRTSNHYIN
jgi:hypothetical protein